MLQRSRCRTLGLALLTGMLAGAMIVPAEAAPSRTPRRDDSAAKTAKLELTHAETQMVEAELRNAEHDDSWWGRLLSDAAPILTALVAVVGLWATVYRAGQDRRDALDREQSEAKRVQAAAEIERFDERFAHAVAGLSSSNPGEQSGAAVMVASMVREKDAALSDQALQLLLVSMQMEHNEPCERLLRSALERFARVAPKRLLSENKGRPTVGLAHIRAPYLNLAGLKLPRLDLAFAEMRKASFRGASINDSLGYKAMLENADFRSADLTRVQWSRVRLRNGLFKEATLVNAQMHEADLANSNFYRANLSGAKFRLANLTGAQFKHAVLDRADFHGADLDERALLSILEAADWQSAKFSQPVMEELTELAKRKRAPSSQGTA